MADIDNELRSQKEKSTNEGKKLTLKIKKLNKIITSQLEGLRKENQSIVHYLKARTTILQNDDSILRSTFHKELVHMSNLVER